MDPGKWKRIKRSGGFRRKVNKNYKSLNISKIPTINLDKILPRGPGQEESSKNQSGSLHFTTLNQALSEPSQDKRYIIQSGSAQLLLAQDVIEKNILDLSEDMMMTSNDEDESSEELDKDEEFREGIKKWAIDCNVPHDTIKKCCKVINRRLPNILPKDPRTLLKTKTVSIIPIDDNGLYWHNGLIETLKTYLESTNIIPENVSLNINFDGLPIYKSSREQIWPILCNIFEKPHLPPFVVGIYSGKGKPANLEAYLRSFVEEMKELLLNNLRVTKKDGKVLLVKVKIRSFICDSPARALIKGVCNFNGKHGCLKCTVVGEYSHQSNTVIFPNTDCPKRNNEEFRSKIYGQHHKYDSPLLELPVDMIEDFPVGDSLHLIDLGVMKRLLMGWRDGNFGKKVTKLCARDIAKLSLFLISCRLPKEIHRSVRTIDVLAHWKASEFRTFLYYLSLIILKDLLCPDAFHHFLSFFCAVTICSNDKHFAFLRLADNLIKFFVENYGKYYGEGYLTSNVHNLTHIVDEVNRFGILQSFNAYPFENKLYYIKRMVRHGNRALSQIARRIIEKNNIELESYDDSQNENKIPFIRKCQSKYGLISILHLENFVLSTKVQDKWFLSTNEQVVEIFLIDNNNNGNIEIHGNCLKNLTDVFETPIKSSFLNIYKCTINTNKSSECLYNVNDVKCKLVCVTHNNTLFFIPLLHTL